MVGCAAYGCTNRSEKGFIVKKFPKDPARRKIWAAKVKRDSWFPTNASVLCEVHFENSMWEKTRVDGTRKLKANAVPTLFCFSKPQNPRNAPKDRSFATCADSVTTENFAEETAATSILTEQADPQPESVTNNLGNKDLVDEDNNSALVKKLNLYSKRYNALLAKSHKYRKELQKLKREQTKSSDPRLLRGIFNEDQIRALKRKSPAFMKWSNATVTKKP